MKSFLILPLFLAASCSSTSYGDATATETVNVAWGSTDLQTFSGEMVESLMEAPGLGYIDHSGKGADKRIVLYFGGIENRTGEHVDLGGLRDKMTASLVGKGKFRIVAEVAGQDEIGLTLGWCRHKSDPFLSSHEAIQVLISETFDNLRACSFPYVETLAEPLLNDDGWYRGHAHELAFALVLRCIPTVF